MVDVAAAGGAAQVEKLERVLAGEALIVMARMAVTDLGLLGGYGSACGLQGPEPTPPRPSFGQDPMPSVCGFRRPIWRDGSAQGRPA